MMLLCCPTNGILPLPNVHMFPEKGPTEAINATLQYLRRLHRLLSLASPLAQMLHDLELDSFDASPDPNKYGNFGEAWKALDRRITEVQKEWNSKNGKSRCVKSTLADNQDLLFYDSHLVSQWFLLRSTMFFQRLPTPLHPDNHIPGTQFIGSCFLALTKRIIDVICDIPTDSAAGPVLAQLPYYVIKGMIFSVVSARRALRYMVSRAHTVVHEFINEPKLSSVEMRLEALGGVVGDLFAEIRERRTQAEALLSLSADQTLGGLGGGYLDQSQGQLDLDWFNIDFNAWLASSDSFLTNLAPSQGVVSPLSRMA